MKPSTRSGAQELGPRKNPVEHVIGDFGEQAILWWDNFLKCMFMLLLSSFFGYRLQVGEPSSHPNQ
jgi:hypothetical protein